jgi:hypothetical protein
MIWGLLSGSLKLAAFISSRADRYFEAIFCLSFAIKWLSFRLFSTPSIKKRVDYVVYLDKPGQYLLSHNNIDGIIVNKPVLVQAPLYTYLHSKHAKLVPQLSEALKAMKLDGSYQRLVDKHKAVYSTPN